MTIEDRITDLSDQIAAAMAELARITTPITPALYRVSEAAAALRVDRSIVSRLIREGHLPTVTLPTMTEVRIPAAALAALVAPDRWSTTPHLQAVGS